jgi:hypothetical protein
VLCASGVTLQALIDLGNCAIGDKVFSAFAACLAAAQRYRWRSQRHSRSRRTSSSTTTQPSIRTRRALRYRASRFTSTELPEHATLALLGAGLAAVVFAQRGSLN